MTWAIRRAGIDDAAALADLARQLRRHQGDPEGRISAGAIRRDGFGEQPSFAALIAERGGRAVGYALFFDAYEPAFAARGTYLADLFVEEAARRSGIGRALIAAVAADTRRRDRTFVWWASRNWNEGARAFYRSLGAVESPVTAHAVVFEAFQRLAAQAPPLGGEPPA